MLNWNVGIRFPDGTTHRFKVKGWEKKDAKLRIIPELRKYISSVKLAGGKNGQD